MVYLAVDKNEAEFLSTLKPVRGLKEWVTGGNYVELPKGSIAKLIGRELTWDDEPVELVETKDKE